MNLLDDQKLNVYSEFQMTPPSDDELNMFYFKDILNWAPEEVEWEINYLKTTNDWTPKRDSPRLFFWWEAKIASEPQKNENGEWIDAATGATFKDWLSVVYPEIKPATVARKPKSSLTEEEKIARKEVKIARNFAKKFGGEALKGSNKQKRWAEKIRKNFLKSLADGAINKSHLLNEQSARYFATNQRFAHADFWIQNRFLSSSSLVERYKENNKGTNNA